MEERIIQFLKAEGINPTRFAERIGVQRSSISHILSGRNKPSYDFIVKIMESFPSLSPEWLLRGKGMMYKSEMPVQPGLFDKLEALNQAAQPETAIKSDTQAPESLKPLPLEDKSNVADLLGSVGKSLESNPGKRIEKVVIFYSDKTFSDFRPEE